MSVQQDRVAVLGLGLIGSVWARHLAADGVLAGCWNRSPKPEQPGWQEQVSGAISGADVVMICVADPPAVAGILEQVLPQLGPGRLVIQCSTIDPDSSQRFAAQVEATGAAYLESPFTGSKPAAEQRQTVYFVGDSGAQAERAEATLARLSRARIRFADGRAACAIKLALNLQLAVMVEALAESLSYARAAGIPDEAYFACLRENVGWSGLAALKEPKLKNADYSPQFSLKHMHKDVRLTRASAGALDLPALAMIDQRFAEAQAAGLAEEDFCAVAKLIGSGSE